MCAFLRSVQLVTALMLLALPAYAAEAVVGKPAPAFTLTDIDGKTHSLGDYEGRIVVLEWTNHECPFVMKHYDSGNMQKLQQQTTADGVVWLTINSSSAGKQGHAAPDQVRAIISDKGAHQTAYLYDEDGKTGMAYGAKTTPHMYVINESGTLAYMGAIDDDPSPRVSAVEGAHNYVLAALEAVKNGGLPETAQTNPYGCSIKYDTM